MLKKTAKPAKKTSPTESGTERVPYRRTKAEDEEMQRTTFDLPVDLVTRLGMEATMNRTSKGQVLRLILERELPPLPQKK
jgi:hypothetical protein